MPTAKKKAEPKLVPQDHGGALNSGGTPGNRGGRPPSELREAMRASIEERLPILERIIDDPETRDYDRIRAIEVMCRFGLGSPRELSGPDGGPVEFGLVNRAELVERFHQKIERLVAARASEIAKPEPKPLPRKPVEPERAPRPAADPDAVIAVFEDCPTPPPPEQPETVEAIVEASTVPKVRPAPVTLTRWSGNGLPPHPGRAYIVVPDVSD